MDQHPQRLFVLAGLGYQPLPLKPVQWVGFGPMRIVKARWPVAALRAHPRSVYAIGGSPARALRETLEVKYRHAASKGETFLVDDDLLLRLYDLGSEPVAVVSAHYADRNFYVYVSPSTLKPIGAVIMYGAQLGEVPSG